MYNSFSDFLKGKRKISIIQAENPDGDSLGSALALDYLLNDYEVTLYCPVDIPKYLRYFKDWARVTNEFDFNADGYIIVDTAAEILLSKLLDDVNIKNHLVRSPIFVLDHHETEDDLSFAHKGLIQNLPACCDLIYKIAIEQRLLSKNTDSLDGKQRERERIICEYLYYGIMSDTLGMVSPNVTVDTYEVVTDLLRRGVKVAELDEYRRDFMKKSPRILDYKADLIKRVQYYLDGTLATVHITWDDITEYSDEYNPNVLILEELRMVEGVEIAVAIKTYPDGKVTGKIRTSSKYPFADRIAEFFGGGGHPFASGFRTYDLSYEDTVHELITVIEKLENEKEESNKDE